MERPFLAAYMSLVVSTCMKRGAPATGGMAANILEQNNEQEIIEKVVSSKEREIKAGVDGFMVYDIGLIKAIKKLWKRYEGVNFQTGKGMKGNFSFTFKYFLFQSNPVSRPQRMIY